MALVLMLANMFYSRKLNGFIALKSGVWRNANIEAAFIQHYLARSLKCIEPI